jgi:nucleotidyltransferase substrate binding protein (TIGR01987 family)
MTPPKKIQIVLSHVEESLRGLEESLTAFEKESDPNKAEMIRDAYTKRFEILFEYTWKALKMAAEHQGVEAPGPRPAILEAIRFGWIEDGDFWAEALEARNGSVHDYFGISREAFFRIVKRFANEVATLLKALKKL